MRLADLPTGTRVALTALPAVTATIERHGEMATLVKLAGEAVTVGDATFTRRSTAMWSGNTEVTPCASR